MSTRGDSTTIGRGQRECRRRAHRDCRATCELRNGDISGIAVHIGARILGEAGPSDILVSRTVVDLVAGSGIEFEDRGEHELKGVPGTWRLFAIRG